MIHRREFAKKLSAAGLALATAGRSVAQTSGVTRMLVGFVPGGTADVMARAVAEGLRTAGIQCIVENKPGAGGRLATDALLAAPADGHTFLLTPSTNLTLFPHAYTNLRYGLGDLAYAGIAAEVQFGLAVHHDTGPRTLAEFLERARKDPKNGFFGTPGAGSVMQLLGDLLARHSKAPLQSVPYKGGAAAINDVLAGAVPAAITAVPNLMTMHKANKLRILAVTSERPLPSISDVPTFESAGFPDLTASEYLCVVTRKAVPAAVVDKWNVALANAVKTTAVLSVMDRLGFQPAPAITPDTMARKVAADSARWQVAVKETGFKPAE